MNEKIAKAFQDELKKLGIAQALITAGTIAATTLPSLFKKKGPVKSITGGLK